MLHYVHRGKPLQAAEAPLQTVLQQTMRRYGMPYMQQTFFALPQGILLQQYCDTGRSSIGYDCFILTKPAALRMEAATRTALLLYPLGNSLALRYQNKKYVCTPQHYCYLAGETLNSLRLLLPAGEVRCLYICLRDTAAYNNATAQRRPAVFKSNQKIQRLTESLLYTNLKGKALELFIAARANDLLRHCLFTQGQQNIHIRAQRLEQVKDYIQKHLDESLSDKALAGLYGNSVPVFRKAFKTYFECTPHQYVLSRRLEKAITLLTETSIPVQEIAWMIGFADKKNLNRALVRHFYHPPIWFRKK